MTEVESFPVGNGLLDGTARQSEGPEMLDQFLGSLQLSEHWESLRNAGATLVSDLTSCTETVKPHIYHLPTAMAALLLRPMRAVVNLSGNRLRVRALAAGAAPVAA